MQYAELFKQVDRDVLVVAGLFTRDELQGLKGEGYKLVTLNKNGIRIV